MTIVNMTNYICNESITPAGISPVSEIVAELKAGRMVILVDEEDRENEGDLVLAADHVTPEAINFMAKFGRGLVCLTLTEERCQLLQLPPMANSNGTKYGTKFTVSIEAAEGVTTGISAADRAATIRAAVNKDAKPSDIVQPGHIFPIRAENGGVLMRAGHTEAGCDLMAMAGLTPAAVICEIMKDDGTMARLPDLQLFAAEHGLKIGTIVDLIAYRSENESLVQSIGARQMHTPYGMFEARLYKDRPSGSTHLALVKGTIDAATETLVRVHEPLSMLDLLESKVTTHSWSLHAALARMQSAPQGVLVLLNCSESAETLTQQFGALDGVVDSAAAAKRGKMDLRTYGIGAQILRAEGVRKMRLLGSPRKMPSMQGFALEVMGFESSSEPKAQ